ncbi:MAG: hypothetical protein COA78_14035 [Blastopirellula sp.]|nr:MAG: hypothetical protein COA78_14035 [Blastopirellula sp.]
MIGQAVFTATDEITGFTSVEHPLVKQIATRNRVANTIRIVFIILFINLAVVAFALPIILSKEHCQRILKMNISNHRC